MMFLLKKIHLDIQTCMFWGLPCQLLAILPMGPEASVRVQTGVAGGSRGGSRGGRGGNTLDGDMVIRKVVVFAVHVHSNAKVGVTVT